VLDEVGSAQVAGGGPVDVVHERVAGIDIGKADVKVCVRVPGRRKGSWQRQVRTFATMTGDLLRLRDWLQSERVSLIAMESTGVYWRSVYYLLEDLPGSECWLVNAMHIKKVPGRKSDVSDAEWIADLAAHGLIRPSFVPPEPIRQLRDLTRTRATFVHERTRYVQRLHAELEDAGIKLSLVASDVMGFSGRAMIEALIGGERDPQVLADLAYGRLRRKNAALTESLTGRFGEHHAFMCRLLLDQIDHLDGVVGQLSVRVHEALAPFRGLEQRLVTIVGVGQRTAEVIIAETGGDMAQFPSPAQLVSWAGLCPGTNESAGKQLSGRTRPGNRWLAAAMGDAAAAAARSRNTHIGQRHRHLARRRGKKRAIVATARCLLEAVWHVSVEGGTYRDLGPDHHLRKITDSADRARKAQRLVHDLHLLGYQAVLSPVA
jgi:transposase